MSTPSSTAARPGAVIATLAFAGTVAAIMQTLVTPLIAELPQIFNTSASNTAWVVTVTLLVAGVCVPIAGRLGDLLGKRIMLLSCCVPLIVGSVVCALSSSVVPMIIGRGLQGAGMGLIPLGIALLRDVVPAQRLSSAIALVSASMGIGGGLGLPIAAAVAQYASWRVLFWGAAVLAAIIFALVWSFVPSTPPGAAGQHFDYLGGIGLGIGLVCLLLGISKGADWGWGSATTVGTLVAAVVVLLAWGWYETRTREPLVDLRTTARPPVLLTNLASIFIGIGMYAQMLVFPQLLQLPEATGYGLGQSMLATGLWMAPAGIMMMVVSPISGRLIDARGPKTALCLGAVVLAVGYGVSLVLMGSAWGLAVSGIVINTGVAFAYGSMPALIMRAVPRSETASANGFNTLMRSLGTTIGSAVVGVVLAQMTISFGGVDLASEKGFRVALALGGVVALLSALVASTIPAARGTAEATPPPAPPVDEAPQTETAASTAH